MIACPFSCTGLLGEVLAEELQEDVPVSGRRGVRTIMVKPTQVTGDEWRADGWQFVRAEILPVHQPVHGTCGDFREELANRIRPLIARSSGNEDRSGRSVGGSGWRVPRGSRRRSRVPADE